MTEIYKQIPDYEGLYEVSNTGIVRSIDRYNTDKNGKVKFYPGRNLAVDKTVRNHTTYFRVTLSKDGSTKRVLVHRLVAITFIPTDDETLLINHIDNNGTNNTYTNLEWVTHAQNMQHSQNQGRQFANQSKAGKTAGIAQTAAAIESIKDMVGMRVGLWEVLGYYGKKGTKHHALCRCLGCGSEVPVYAYSLRTSRSVGCVSCVRSKKKI